MHFKLYPPDAAGDTKGTEIAYVGTASSKNPLGPFTYEGKYIGGGSPNGSGDFGIFKDDEGSFWHVAVRKPDKLLVCGKLREDGLRPAGEYVVMEGVERATEAPALFQRAGKIYLLGSGSTGWNPNAARMHVADRIQGPYRSLGNPCIGVNPHNKLGPEKSFGGQSTFVMPSPRNKDEWIAMFDIWNPKEPVKAGYIWLPLRFENDKPVIRWESEWKLDGQTSRITEKNHLIAVNQIGYDARKPKRFTAPISEDGTSFIVRPAKGGEPVFRSKIRGNIGDFSAIEAPSGEYVIEVRGGKLGNGTSDPFLIQPGLPQAKYWQAAVDFLIDSRSAIGTHASAYGGSSWRDGTYYDAIVPSLVLLYLSDPKRIESMPKQIDWAAEKKRVLSPGFKFNEKDPGSKGFMKSVAAYYELEPPSADAPDVVKMIHWGAGFTLVNPVTFDPSNDPDKRKIHSQSVEQVAYVIWAWPVLKQWLPESFYRKCRDFCFANWKPSLEISPWWETRTYLKPEDLKEGNPMGGLLHPYKGRHAPGHSIVPNLLMHEVAKREGRDDAAIYLDAAVQQAEWCVKNLDWNDPRTTKGHRMSEHRTIPNLVWLLQHYPEQAPARLKEKINSWVDVAISHSGNLWDYRRYDMGEHWSVPKLNDVGNLLSFPAIAIAASWVIDDPAKKARLEEISTATIDHVFGRNPRLAAAPANPAMGFPDIERGWPNQYKPDVCARLELCRGSISSAPGSEMFPFHPEGAYRHPEGWVNYGAAWCVSLAYLQFEALGKNPKP